MSKEFITCTKQFKNPNIDKYLSIFEDIVNREKAEIVFVGEFSNGKSSVLNALIGTEILPTGIGTITSKITFIEKGIDNVASYNNRENVFDINNAQNEIENIIKFQDKDDNTLHIKLQNFPFDDYIVVDTPGINDKDREKELITYEYAPRADAMVFILDAGRGFTKYEADFFKDLSDSAKDKIFVVINKIDAYEELADNSIQAMLDSQGISKSKAFVVSAKWALQAIKTNDNNLLHKSNINQLKNALVEYVSNTDSRVSVNTRKKNILERIYSLSKLEIDYKLQGLELDAQKIAVKLQELSVELTQAKEEQTIKLKDLKDMIENTQIAVNESIQLLKKELEESYFSLSSAEQKKDFIDSGKVKSIFEKFKNNLSKNFEELNIDVPIFDTELLIANIFKKAAGAIAWLEVLMNTPIADNITEFLEKIPKIGKVLKVGAEFIKKAGKIVSETLQETGETIESYFINLDSQIKSAISTTEKAVSDYFHKFKITAEMQLNKTVEDIEAKISGYEMARNIFNDEKHSIDAKIIEITNLKSKLEDLYKNNK